MSPSLTMAQKMNLSSDGLSRMFDNYDFSQRTAMPGIIQSFDPDNQTVEVLIAVTEKIRCDVQSFIDKYQSNVASIPIPILKVVPIVLPHAGGYSLTFPVQEGDECLVIFADTCIDSWWDLGAKDSTTGEVKLQDQYSVRRHSLNDGFAILGTWSKPRATELTDYFEDGIQLRNDAGEVKINLTDDGILINNKDEQTIEITDTDITISVGSSTSINIKDGEVTITATKVNLSGDTGLRALIDERLLTLYNAHTHLIAGVQTGTSSVTSAVPLVPLLAAAVATTKTKAL